MIIMHIYIDNIYSLNALDIDFSYSEKIANSLIENEHLKGFPAFRYKKVNIIMGANASGKTTLGLAITNFVSCITTGNLSFMEQMIRNKEKDSLFSMDLVDDGKHLRRFKIIIEASSAPLHERCHILHGSETIKRNDSYQTCSERLNRRELEIYRFDEPINAGWAMVSSDTGCAVPENIDGKVLLKVLDSVLRTLDPFIDEVVEIPNTEKGYVIKKDGREIIFQGTSIADAQILSHGTRAGIQLSYLIAGILSHSFACSWCDEQFCFIHSEIEKRIFGIMMSNLGENEQLFFTSHTGGMLDLNLPKHSYTFLVRDFKDGTYMSRAVYADTAMKNYSGSLRNAVENSVMNISPVDKFLDELEDIGL